MREWTADQKLAINEKNSDVLVSAAAGSGKTSVLTERLFRSLTDENNPKDLSRMLVVTFTRAAADELRERISNRLKESVVADPSNRHVIRQIQALPSANIGTIHSFCMKLVKRNFEYLGLNPAVRVADAAESSLISVSVMEKLIDDLYSATESHLFAGNDVFVDNERKDGTVNSFDFGKFVDNFVTDRDDRLCDQFLLIYSKALNNPEGVKFILLSAERLNMFAGDDFFSTPWGERIKSRLLSAVGHYRDVFTDALAYFSDDDKLFSKYGPSFESDMNFAVVLEQTLCNKGYEESRRVIGEYKKIAIGRQRLQDQDPKIEFFKEIRDSFGTFLKNSRKKYFKYDSEKISCLIKDTSIICDNLYKVLSEFETRYTSEKFRRGVVDFDDLEHFALKILYRDDGELSEIAHETAEMFDEVYIDEYQDVNSVQDLIFRAISKKNRFMVGDIKQSIYGFRGSEPQIFSKYRSNFNRADECFGDLENRGKSVFLKNNFRSDEKIIKFVNTVFETVMGRSDSEIEYGNDDMLVFSKKSDIQYEEQPSVTVSVISPQTEADFLSDETDNVETEDSYVFDDDPKQSEMLRKIEARYVAGEISSLLKTGKYRPSDIKILLRSPVDMADFFESALKEYGIHSFSSTEKDFFNCSEILLALCLLKCIDNPTRDVYLAGLLKSPLFDFTLNELAEIRNFRFEHNECDGDSDSAENRREESLYESLCRFCKFKDYKKGRYFLDKLEHYRAKAVAEPVDRLIWYLFHDIGIFVICKDKLGTDNLMRLYEYARSFENGSFRGLNNFLRYLDDITNTDPNFDMGSANGNSDDKIEIMSVHKSKGLEFPVCFLCGCDKAFNYRDNSDIIIIDSKMGVTSKLRDETGFARFDTPMRTASILKMNEDRIEEEKRVMYVALTRAKERLYVTAPVLNAEKLFNGSYMISKYVSDYTMSDSPSYIKWILSAVAKSGCSFDDLILEGRCGSDFFDVVNIRIGSDQDVTHDIDESGVDSENKAQKEIVFEEDEKKYAEIMMYEKLFRERFMWDYKGECDFRLPSKLSVSMLRPDILDDTDLSHPSGDISLKNVEVTDFRKENLKIKKPRFLEECTEFATAADRGTATHLFMQFCSFENVVNNGVDAELERLYDAKFITDFAYKNVYTDRIDLFFKSECFAELSEATDVYRELRFNVNLNASEFVEDEEKKNDLSGKKLLVQGVIDCLYITNDGKLKLLDYKTDNFVIRNEYDRADARKKLSTRYRLQMKYYAKAAEMIVCRPVDSINIYSFALNETVNMNDVISE